MLGFGAYLVIRQELTAGAMIAASIMMGRALAPIEIAIANWRSLTAARQSMSRLSAVLAQVPSKRASTALPKPARSLDIEHIAVAAPNGKGTIVPDVHFQLAAGEPLGIIGPTGAGKTSPVRKLNGVWRPPPGNARPDGPSHRHWVEAA